MLMLGKRRNERFGKLAVGDERNVHVDRSAANDKAVGVLADENTSRDIYNEIERAVFKKLGNIR